MEQLRGKRAPLRTAFSKALKALQENLQESEPKKEEIEVALEQLKNKSDRLREIDDTILEALLKAKATEAEYAHEFETCEAYVEKFVEAETKTKQILAPREIVTKIRQNEGSRGDDDRSRVLQNGLKLPKINLVEFDGDARNWLNWWNCFQKIHEDPGLDDHSKFVYLIQATVPKSKAREIVQSFPTSCENYPKVIEHLRSRFGREYVLIQIYVRDLLQLVLNNSTKKNCNLSSLYDKLETKLRALESLGVTKDKYASVIYPLVESCLPPETLRIWEREREKTEKGKSDLDSILEFLKIEVLSEERMSLARNSFGFEKPKKCFKNNESDEGSVATCSDLWVGDKQKNSAPIKKFEELCIFCDKAHPSQKCFKASSLSYEEKKNLIFRKGACYVCLRKNHISRNCKAKIKCDICNKRHLSVVCPGLTPSPQKSGEIKSSGLEKESDSNTALSSRVENAGVLLQTLIVRLKNGNREKFIRAIVDTGSEKTYVTDDVIEYLKCKSLGERKLIHKLFGGIETQEKVHNVYKIHVSSLDNKFSSDICCLNESVICSDVRRIPKGPWLDEIDKHGIQITDIQGSIQGIESDIKLLIGSDIAGKLFTGNIKYLSSGPVAMQTRLGWVLFGKINENNISKCDETFSCVSLLLNGRSAENFWRLDVIKINDPVESKTKAEIQEETMDYFKENLSLDSEGRYEIALPWVLDCSRLPSNRELAEKRLDSKRKKLVDSNNKIEVYQEVFDDWVRDNIIEEVGNEKVSSEHYLPHRPVFKESSETTKVRPVFDASAHIKGCVSLNDCLEKGPNLIEIIPSLLNRFRKYEIGVISDIEKAFLQIGIREKDRDFLRFLWRDVSGGEIKIYRHRRVVFGLNCSPFLLAATLNCHLDSAPGQFSDTAKLLKESFYVDNCLTSFKTVEDLNDFVLTSRILLSSAKFNLRGWRSNRESGIISQTGMDGSVFVLGLNWDLERDTLSCKIESRKERDVIASKRTLLSCTNRLFDPMGFTAPATLFPKLALQECWQLKLNWDEKLPEHLEKKFYTWYTKMSLLTEVEVPRWVNVGDSKHEDISLHVFSDASKLAYATCVFLRVDTWDHVSVNFMQARTRVAPLKNVTIPRLELLACSIGARLGNAVASDLRIPGLRIFYWSDSTTALSWIQRDVRWGTFVWNRVQEIRALTKIEDWRHVPSELNAADLPSRGCSVEHFLQSKWWEGPTWLKEPEATWPCNIETPDEDVVSSEMRKSVLAAYGGNSEPNDWFYRYFSSYPKILRLTAWILRFLYNTRKIDITKETELSYFELQRAERTVLKLIQKETFAEFEKGNFKNLRPVVDEYGIIRVKTQVEYRKDTEDFKYPVLLPSEHPVVHRLIYWKHQELMHASVSLLMTSLRENYWIVKARKTIKTVIQRCVRCKRFNAKKTESVPIALPVDRVQDADVFQIVRVDLAGPLHLKRARKAWIVLYICAVYRAVHLELVTSLSTEAFLQSFRHFIARRGRPTTVYSDNGKNFVGADTAFSAIDWVLVASTSALQRIQWKFNPSSAAWWGGWWERLIQMAKRILRRVLGRAVLTYEELITVLCDCEQAINARPLTYVTEDVEDLTPLTPAAFLQQPRSSNVEDIDMIDRQGFNNRLKYVQEVREHLRKRFRVEYLGQLKQQMNPKNVRQLSINEVVLLESDQKRTHWDLARILELFPGIDGQTRVAKVKTQTGEFLRPVQRLYSLEVQRNLSPDPIVQTRSGRRVVKPGRYCQ